MKRVAVVALFCGFAPLLEADVSFEGKNVEVVVAPDAPKAEEFAVETRGGQATLVPVRPIPQGGGWFETVWKAYLDGSVFAGED